MTGPLAMAMWMAGAGEHLSQAEALLRQQKLGEAAAAVERALVLEPDSVSALTLQGRLSMAMNRPDRARLSFERAASLAPGLASAQFLLGFFFYVENDFARALPPLALARKLGPDDPRAALFLALALDGLAKPAEADPMYRAALQLEARRRRPSAETHVAYARFLFTVGRFGDARAEVSRALAVEPGSREAHYELARLHLEAGEAAGCVEQARQALELRGGEGAADRQIHFLLARAYAALGDGERAAQHRRRFEAIPPKLVR